MARQGQRVRRAGALGLALVAGVALSACDTEVPLAGERFPVRAPLEASIPTEGEPAPIAPPEEPANETRAIALPGAVANADWPQRGGSATHQAPHGALSASPALAWAVDIGAGNSRRARITASPIVLGGVVYAMDAATRLSAVSTQGALLWQVDLTAPFDRGGEQSGGGLAGGQGRIFATTGYGEVVAVETASGAVIWRQRLGSPAAGAPTVAGSTVYAMGADGTGWALEAGSGRVLWTLAGAGQDMATQTGAAPVVTGGTVIFPFPAGVMVAAEAASGTAEWQAAITGNRLGRAYATSGDITGDPVVVGGTVYVGTEAGRTGAFRAESGERFWTAEEGALNTPLVVGGSVFAVGDNARLVRLDADSGARIWAVDLPGFTDRKAKRYSQITAHFGPVLAGGRLVVASSDGVLRLMDPASGAAIGQVALPGGAASGPVLAGGMLFVVSGKGQLLAFR